MSVRLAFAVRRGALLVPAQRQVFAQQRVLASQSQHLRAHLSTSSAAEKPERAAEAETAKQSESTAEAGADGAAAEGSGDGDPVVSEVEQLQARITEMEETVEKKHDQLLRALADADNMRRRAKIDVADAHKFALGKFAKSLLDVADNLARAADSVPEEMRASDEQPVLRSLYEGVSMTDAVLHKCFSAHGELAWKWPMAE